MNERFRIDYKKYLDLLRDNDYLELYDYYSRETYMDILGVARQENPHSSFLRWLLDIHGEHGYSSQPMRKFLETVCLFREKVYGVGLTDKADGFWKNTDNILSSDNSELLEEIQFGRYEILNQNIANEIVLNNQRRADIFGVLKIRFQRDDSIRYLIVLVENKVHSQEHYGEANIGQTEAYVKDLDKKETIRSVFEKLMMDPEGADDCKTLKLFVYLNAYRTDDIKNAFLKIRDGSIEKKDAVYFAKSREFITLNYQYVLDGIIEPLYGMKGCNENVTDRIYDYIRCLGQSRISSIYDHKRDIEDEYLIMAVSNRERMLALSLLEKYYSIILPIIESLSVTTADNYGGFLLNNDDREFWVSISNLYRMMKLPEREADIGYNEACERLTKVVATVNKVGNTNKSRKHRYTFKGNIYESYTVRSVGLLCRDLIADFVTRSENNASEQEEKLQDLRKEILSWNLNWLKEVILFDDEVEEINRNGSCNVSGCKYHTDGIGADGFAGSFFSYMDILVKQSRDKQDDRLKSYDRTFDESSLGKDYKMEILLANGRKAYVAKFWGSDDLERLIEYLDNKDSCHYKDGVKKEY